MATMKYLNTSFILVSLLYCTLYVQCSIDEKVVSGRIESCPGCQLNRLPEVKKFIFEDVPKYQNMEYKRIHGAPPELVMLNAKDQEIDRIKLESFTRQECNDLLASKGFQKKAEQRGEF